MNSPGSPTRAEDLVPAVLAGEARAVEAWYRAEHPVVWRLCLGFLADATEADDIAQDAMLQLLDHLGAWDRARSWAHWRNTVVLNLCRDRLRRNASRRLAEKARSARTLPQVLPHPGVEIERGEVNDLIAGALASLAPREREAFVLIDLECQSTEAAACALGVAPGSARSLLALARRRLRNLLGPKLAVYTEGEPDAEDDHG